jgi:hypothetical protein
MDSTAIQNQGPSDLLTLAIVLAVSTVAVVVALAVAGALRLDRFAARSTTGRNIRVARVAAAVLGLLAATILLGIVPATALLQGWGPVACILVLGSLMSASAAVSTPCGANAAASSGATDSAVSKAAA